ncbi:MAG: hypothetical protein RQ760_19365 [Sedimentisphaerales bacterium]|nr:hypothetical protein [Sedimentisphaerales bacterium]
MRSIAVALTWEFWRRSRWWIFTEIIVMACITTVLYGRISSLDAKTHAEIHYMTLFYEFICFAYFILFFQFYRKNKRLGFPAHLYLKPTRTWVLVGWQMLLPAVTIVLLYLVSVGCARILLGITWPLPGPILLLAAAVACTQAIIWSMVGFPILRFVVCLLVLKLLHAWQFSRYGSLQEYPNISRMWTELTSGELLTMVSCLAAAYIVAVIGVSSDRRGDCVGWPGFWGRLGRVRDLLPGRQKPFHSPAAAQFWREWHEKDWLIPAASGLCVGGIILSKALGINDTRNTIVAFVFLLQIGLGVPFFAGLIFGQCGRKSKIDDFKATLPVSNSRLSAMILRPGAAGLLSALAIYIAGLLLVVGWLFITGEGETVTQGWHGVVNKVHEFGYGNTLQLVAVGIIIAWGLVGMGASMTFIGRPWLVWGFWLVICSVGPVVMVLDTLHTFNLIPFGIVPALWISAPWTIGICCLLGTTWAFFSARRQYLIASRTLCLGLGLWLILCISIGFMWLTRDKPEPSSIVLVMGLLTLPVAPLATAPLALAWNRHR